MRDHRRASEANPDFPEVLYVHPGDREEGDLFFERFWPEAHAIAGANGHLHEAFDVRRGRLGQLLGPRALARGVSALLRGNGVGKPVGDPRLLPGLLLIDDRHVLWRQAFEHAGARSDLDEVVRVAEAHSRRTRREPPGSTLR